MQDGLFRHVQGERVLKKRSADGGTRTRTPVRAGDFKSPVSAIPPHPHDLASISPDGKKRQGLQDTENASEIDLVQSDNKWYDYLCTKQIT